MKPGKQSEHQVIKQVDEELISKFITLRIVVLRLSIVLFIMFHPFKECSPPIFSLLFPPIVIKSPVFHMDSRFVA